MTDHASWIVRERRRGVGRRFGLNGALVALLLLGTARAALAVCGDGIIDGVEACDDGVANGTPNDCCSATCQFQSATTVCRPIAGACDVGPEFCTGTSDTCPADVVKASGTVCRSSQGVCDIAEICDGTHRPVLPT